jgi:Pyrimidine dimer DNA glycosylase
MGGSHGPYHRLMRLWTLHPKYLDSKGLVAAWREALLAQKVLAGATKGYRHHPQLIRFQSHASPLGAIAAFLRGLLAEAQNRGYHFDASKIPPLSVLPSLPCHPPDPIVETRGQLQHEWKHLKRKLQTRAPDVLGLFRLVRSPDPHPLFRIVPGPIRDWERA